MTKNDRDDGNNQTRISKATIKRKVIELEDIVIESMKNGTNRENKL